jgi:hypothetical protein
LGKVLDSIVKEWKVKGLEDDPFYHLLVEAANEHADEPKVDSLVERVITEAPLCTCEWGYKGSHALLHGEQCPFSIWYSFLSVNIFFESSIKNHTIMER